MSTYLQTNSFPSPSSGFSNPLYGDRSSLNDGEINTELNFHDLLALQSASFDPHQFSLMPLQWPLLYLLFPL